MTIFNKSLLRYWDIEILRFLRHDLLGIIYRLTFHPSLPPSKIFPFPLSFRKYIVTLPHGGLQHEEQAILICTILQWQHSLLPHPLPMNKNQADTAKCACTPQRCATMICFWIKKIKNPLPSQILSVYLPANKK